MSDPSREGRRSMWNLRSLAECLLDTPRGAPINEGLARDLAREAIVADFHAAALAARVSRLERLCAGRRGQMHEYRIENEFMKNERQRLAARVTQLEEEVRLREQSQYPVIPTAAWREMERLRARAAELAGALSDIVCRERRSEYGSIYSAPSEFADIARAALAGVPAAGDTQ